MNLVDSPSLDYQETGAPSEKPKPWWRRHIPQLVLVGLNVLLAVVIAALLISQPELLRPSGSLAGQVVDALGHPLPQAQLFIVSAKRWAVVDGQGRFVVDRIPPGETAVLFVSTAPDVPPLGPPLSAVVTIPSGQTLDVGIMALPSP